MQNKSCPFCNRRLADTPELPTTTLSGTDTIHRGIASPSTIQVTRTWHAACLDAANDADRISRERSERELAELLASIREQI